MYNQNKVHIPYLINTYKVLLSQKYTTGPFFPNFLSNLPYIYSLSFEPLWSTMVSAVLAFPYFLSFVPRAFLVFVYDFP